MTITVFLSSTETVTYKEVSNVYFQDNCGIATMKIAKEVKGQELTLARFVLNNIVGYDFLR